MKRHHVMKSAAAVKHFFQNNYGMFGIFAFLLLGVFVFNALRGVPSVSELAYIEHSALGESAGSVVPASCDAASIAAGGTPGSHFYGDCWVVCPAPAYTGFYDPYFDPGLSTCVPVPVIKLKTQTTNPFVTINSFSNSPGFIDGGGTITWTWSASGDGASCTIGGPSVPLQAVPLVGSLPLYRYYNDWITHPITLTLTCTDGSRVVSATAQAEWNGVSCFVADTKVSMADGSTKNIQDLIPGDKLMGEAGTINTVTKMEKPLLGDRLLYSLNGGTAFVTAEHPFMTTAGWKSIDPDRTRAENSSLHVGKLRVGDVLVTEHGNVVIVSITASHGDPKQVLYNPLMSSGHTYYADGYLVHNKSAPP